MSTNDQQPDPDDMFADTRMTFGEHIEDLRTHLLRALKGFVIAFLLAFLIAKPVLHIIRQPVEEELKAFWDRYSQERLADPSLRKETENLPPIPMKLRVSEDALADFMERRFNLPPAPKQAINLLPSFLQLFHDLKADFLIDHKAIGKGMWVELPAQIADPGQIAAEIAVIGRTTIYPPSLTTLSVQEALVVFFEVALVTGLVLGSPWIFYQIWSFIAAGLYPHEKRYVNSFLPLSLALFLGGVLVCQFFVMRKAVEALLWFNYWMGLQPDPRLNEWLGFAIFMPVVFGLSFQTPLVMLVLQRIGMFTVEAYRSKRKISWFVMAVFAAVVTPSIDPVSMMLLWIPMSLLYELGIFLCWFLPGGREESEFDVPEPGEMVEV